MPFCVPPKLAGGACSLSCCCRRPYFSENGCIQPSRLRHCTCKEIYMRLPRTGLLLSLILTLTGIQAMADEPTTDRAKKFIKTHDSKFKPLDKRAGIAWWDANTSGKDEDFARKEEAQNAIDAALADPKAFAEMKELKQAKDKGQIDDKTVARCIDVLYLMYLEKQVDSALLKKIVAKANAVEQAFNVFRANVEGKEMPDAEVRKVLKESKDSARRKAVWGASKEVGAKVEKDLKELVQLRNEAAKQLGYPNFHALQLYLNEQDGAELIKLFDDLDQLTREPFHKAKAEIDSILAKDYGI